MNISLPPEQQNWLNAQIHNGMFRSVDEALAHIVSDRMAIDADSFSWAAPAIEEARAQAQQGNVVSLDHALSDIDEVIASLKT